MHYFLLHPNDCVNYESNAHCKHALSVDLLPSRFTISQQIICRRIILFFDLKIITLRNIRKVKTFYLNKRHSIGGIVDEYIEALTKADRLIQAHIENKYGILEIKQ